MREDADPRRDAVYDRYYESRAAHNVATHSVATHSVAAHYGVRAGRYTRIRFSEPEHDYWELYDLRSDPRQVHRVYDDPEHAGVVTILKMKLGAPREQYRDD